MGVKESIDIEELLIWAYRDQCVDRSVVQFSPRGPSSSISSGLRQLAALGCRVDTSPFAARALGMRTPDDAMVVHDAVLALPEMLLQFVGMNQVAIWTFASAEAAGWKIETVEHQPRLRRVFGDRVGAPGAVLTFAHTVAMVVVHAKNGTRPITHDDWRPRAGRPAGDARYVDARGRSRVVRDGPTQEEVMRDRALYQAWHDCLGLLAAELRDCLQGYAVSPPSAAGQPWRVSEKRVLESQIRQIEIAPKSLKIRRKKIS